MKLNSSNITTVIAIAAIVSPVLVQIIKSFFDYRLSKREFDLKQSIRDDNKRERDNKIKKQDREQYVHALLDFVSAINECVVLYSNSAAIKDRFIKRREAVNLGLMLLPYLQTNDQKIILSVIEELDKHDPNFNDLHAQSKKVNSEILRLLDKQYIKD